MAGPSEQRSLDQPGCGIVVRHLPQAAPYNKRPFELPKYVDLDEFDADPTLRLGKHNYKVACASGRTREELVPTLTVANTGAGPVTGL